MPQTVTPWEVKGKVDYDKLIREFGLKPLENLPPKFNESVLFRRGLIFAHRDFGQNIVADQAIFYQKLGAKVYLLVADLEAYNSRNPNLKELREIAITEYLTNYVALGLDLQKCEFYFQSKRSKNGEKSSAYYRLATMLARHVTFNEFKAVYGEISPGKMVASLLQASDMLHPQLKEFEG